jgi:integrase
MTGVQSRTPPPFDVRTVGVHLPRTRYQRGWLTTYVPGNRKRPRRNLPRGRYWAQWHQYVIKDGKEKRRRREKIIDKEVARQFRIGQDYAGPLTKTDAQRVLDLLIARDAGSYCAPDMSATFEKLARQYIELNKPHWGPKTRSLLVYLIEKYIIGALGPRLVADISQADVQIFINRYVSEGRSRSLLIKLLAYTRAILELAVDQKIIERNPARKVKAKSQARPSEMYLSLEECGRLLAAVSGRDHLILRMFIQLGLRPQEMFALRRNDRQGDVLMIDEEGALKSEASKAPVYVPADLAVELDHWLSASKGNPEDWMFRTARGKRMNAACYRRYVLKPAAIRAGVAVEIGADGTKRTSLNFQTLRRTCATHFGKHATARDTQAQLRHADPVVTLRHYQKSVPASIRSAAGAFESELMAAQRAAASTIKQLN